MGSESNTSNISEQVSREIEALMSFGKVKVATKARFRFKLRPLLHCHLFFFHFLVSKVKN